ncbi:Nramp family divalent metal transporter [Parahaliea sp. F7430]|uniref:Nramp family divalent metal transporter n=1 Tax=Sediminihaliea albiluteola TaxID=2758564 RepID=A0A7W2TVQ3_9GAMM|nr:Nramp family divalent metal transporter [Sediminihaliea albiluteola]MBA6412823.1 Nramp family divalent metal transporter [Sediminihaliea albiluteola]
MSSAFMRKFGPGLLVTAAFIGPGTITTASSAGANFGFALLWALLFSLFATIILQEMAARLGLVTREGLAEAMRAYSQNPLFGRAAVLLVIAAVGAGNAAYEAGNIAGAALALELVSPLGSGFWATLIGISAGILLFSGRYRILESALVLLVLVMSTVFLLTAWMVAPSPIAILDGMFRPRLPEGSVMTVIALIGTTVVPYNLFLHANAVREKWPATLDLEQSLKESRLDTGLSISLGGLVTLAILSTAAAAFFQTGLAFSGDSIALQLEPLLGPSSRYVFAAGLFAGGLTSAITAPLAAAFAVCGALGWRSELSAPGFRLVWLFVLATGTVFAALGSQPLAAILFAQVANGFLLPIVAIFLLVVMNQRQRLGEHVNGPVANTLGAFVVLVALGLGAVKLLQVAGLI